MIMMQKLCPGDISKVDELIKLKYFVYFAFITEFNYPDSNVA